MDVSRLSEDSRETAIAAAKMRMEAAGLEAEAKEMKEAANVLLYSILSEEAEDCKLEVDGVGKFALVTTNRTHVSVDKAKSELQRLGVNVGVIAAAFTNATSATSSESVRFTPEKE